LLGRDLSTVEAMRNPRLFFETWAAKTDK